MKDPNTRWVDIVVCVRGGVAEVLSKRHGCSIEIRDYDTDGSYRAKKDSCGDYYTSAYWGNSVEIS
jgi:hypothetical protein